VIAESPEGARKGACVGAEGALKPRNDRGGALKPQIILARMIMVKPSQVRSGSLVCYGVVFLCAQTSVDG
jgi:hypothetical protein